GAAVRQQGVLYVGSWSAPAHGRGSGTFSGARVVECGNAYGRGCTMTAVSERLGGPPAHAPARQVVGESAGRADAVRGPIPLWLPLLIVVLLAVHLLAG